MWRIALNVSANGGETMIRLLPSTTPSSAIIAMLSLLGLLTVVTTTPLHAQGYPNRPIRMVVPFPPGGIVDLNGRAVSKLMEEKLGVPIVIDNRAGAGGLVGTVA